MSQPLPDPAREDRAGEAGCGVYRAGGEAVSEGRRFDRVRAVLKGQLVVRRRESPTNRETAFPDPGPSQFPQRLQLPATRRNHG